MITDCELLELAAKAAENLRLADIMAAALVEQAEIERLKAYMSNLTTALSECRDSMPDLPGIPIDEALQYPEAVPAYVLATVTQLMAMIDTRPQRREPLTDDEWLNYLLTHADNSVLHVAADKNNSIRMDGKWYLRADANNLRKLVEKVHGIGAKP